MRILEKDYTKNKNELLLVGSSFPINPILVIGVVHGDEPQGEYLINKYLTQNESKLLFIPCLNPDGKNNNTRVNSNGVDLNRNFPTKNWELTNKDKYYGGATPASETETKFLINIIEKYKPRLIFTLHTPYKIVNYDGPAYEVANEVSKIIGYPVEDNIGYPTPGSFGTYVGVERHIPIITLEMDEDENIEILYSKIKKIFIYLENYQ